MIRRINNPFGVPLSGSAAQLAGAGGGGFLPEAEALFAAMTVQPDEARKTLINDTVAALMAAGVWTKYQELYVFAAHDVQAALLNWKTPAQSATRLGTATFTVDRGFTGNGGTGGANTMRIDSFANVNTGIFTANSAHFSTYVNAGLGGDSNNIDCGTSVGGDAVGVLLGNGNTHWAIRDAGGSAVVVGAASGSWISTALNPTAFLYRNGAQVGTKAYGQVAAPASKFAWLGVADGTAWSNRRLAYGSYGSNLTPGEASAKHTALLAYLISVGAS